MTDIEAVIAKAIEDQAKSQGIVIWNNTNIAKAALQEGE